MPKQNRHAVTSVARGVGYRSSRSVCVCVCVCVCGDTLSLSGPPAFMKEGNGLFNQSWSTSWNEPALGGAGPNRKERNGLFNDGLITFLFTVIWRGTYGKGPLR